MYSLILHGRKSITELQKWRHLSDSLQNLFFNSYSTDVNPTSIVPYLVDSLGLNPNLAESISSRVSSEGKTSNNNPVSVLNLLTSYGFTDSHISSIVTNYPRLLSLDADKSLGPKLQFLQSRAASTSELTEIVSKVPKILGKKEGKASSIYYDFVKDIIEADKSSKHEKLCLSLAEGSKQENKIRNLLVLRDLGVPQKVLFSLLISNSVLVNGKARFEESLKKVVEMGFDPKTPKFVRALHVIQGWSETAIQGKIDVYKRLGFSVEDVWTMFKKCPVFFTFSEKKILNSLETFIGLGFTREEFVSMAKSFPHCIQYSVEAVKKKTEFLKTKTDWPLKSLVTCPQVLGYNLEKRTVPRCNVIKALMSKGLLGNELPSVSYVLRCADEIFLERYVTKLDDKQLVSELMAIFNGARVA